MGLALRCVLINLSAVFLTESLFFFLGADRGSLVHCVRGENKLYLYGNVLVNYSPSLTVAEGLRAAKRPQGAFGAIRNLFTNPAAGGCSPPISWGDGGEVWSAEGERVRGWEWWRAQSARVRGRAPKTSHPPGVLLDFLPLNTVPTDSHDAGHMIPAHKPPVCFSFKAKRKRW